MFRNATLSMAIFLAACTLSPAQPASRDKKVRDDKQKVEQDGFWIYNDLPKALAEAKATGKPIVVALRCIPCEECVKLDDELVDADPRIRPLLEKFVRVRIISTNGLDLSLFQYDTDQSFAVFFLNADKTIYGRFGTRSDRKNWVGDVSIEGLGKALQKALALHNEYPKNKAQFAGKQGPAPEFPTPEKFPTLTAKYTDKLNYEGNLVQSCIHCHQIGDARKSYYRTRDGKLPEEVVFPYPHPKALGLILDPKECATIKDVKAGSIAEAAGLKAGEEILELNGQPMLSMADVQWVLHQIPASGGVIQARMMGGKRGSDLVTITLPAGWRRLDDIAWRSTSWGLRRMGTGGMSMEEIPMADRKDGHALKVKFVGTFGAHAAANKAGIKAGDILVSWDGKTDFTRESDILAHGALNHKPGDKIAVTMLRAGKKMDFTLPMQE